MIDRSSRQAGLGLGPDRMLESNHQQVQDRHDKLGVALRRPMV